MSIVINTLAKKGKIVSRKLFKISGKFKGEGEGEYSSRLCDFEGNFILQEDGTIKGYMDEKYDSPYDPLRFIYGVMDGEKLAFLKLSNEKGLAPLVYCFTDVNSEGKWGAILLDYKTMCYTSRWVNCATVEVCEIAWDDSKEDAILEQYNKMGDGPYGFNTDLDVWIEPLRKLLDIS